ncbi:hypothetical protein Goklo_025289 [Gossypium klotzschianum]|uniref:DUF7745 domain-containing protein n=1 Tax=Gossypium klotzschianum TaxID=34286 RepID=A0A7J8WCG3_9ROSI|nr:hypothetical protein [Gossypium klotzschianum]
MEGYVSELWDFTRISVTQNDLQDLKEIWDQWNDEMKQLFYSNYGDLPYLLDIKVDKHLFRALSQYWNPAYSCFTFGKVDLVPTWVAAQIKQKGDSKCIPWKNLRDLILAHPDVRKRVDVLALSIYGLVIFPKVLGHVDEAVSDLFDRLDKRVTPIPAILAEAFRSLSACRRAGEGRFIGCAQLLLAWFHSRFWKVEKVSYRVFSGNYSPLKELVATPRRDDVSKEKIWGAVGYAPLLVLRQYRSRQFILSTQGLAWYEFSYKGDNYKKKISSELGKRIEQLEEEKMCLGLDVDIHKLEAEKLRKGKNKAEEDLDSLKTDYKKLRLLIRTTDLGKASKQWRQEIKEEKTRADRWEKKFQDARA